MTLRVFTLNVEIIGATHHSYFHTILSTIPKNVAIAPTGFQNHVKLTHMFRCQIAKRYTALECGN